MDQIEAQTVWTVILAICAAVVLISNAVEKLAKAAKAARAPSDRNGERLSAIERRLDNVERKLDNDDNRLRDIKKGDRAAQRALIALLEHGIDGNNLEQMKTARDELNNYLIEK